jgi:DNA polymerase epsilon subunit 2
LSAYEDFPYFEKNVTDGRTLVVDKPHLFFGESESKIQTFRNQYLLHEEMLFKNAVNFTRIVREDPAGMIEVPYINNLLGISKELRIFGILEKKEDLNYYLEDTTKSVKLQLKESPVERGKGFFLEGNIVIAKGSSGKDAFTVKEMQHPPIFRQSGIKISEFDHFGAYSFIKKKIMKFKSTQEEYSLTQVNEAINQSALIYQDTGQVDKEVIIVVSNVHLDNPKIMPKLKELFEGIEKLKPRMFVVMGNWVSQPQISSSELKACFSQFAQAISEFEFLSTKTWWTLIPGLEDPGISNIFPKKQLPECLVDILKKKVANVVSATNPCRMSFLGKEMTFCRYNVLQHFKKFAVFPTIGGEQDSFNMAYTILAQKTLVPISSSHIPVVWDFAHSLSFYNPPNYMILADICTDYVQKIEGTFVINTGNF